MFLKNKWILNFLKWKSSTRIRHFYPFISYATWIKNVYASPQILFCIHASYSRFLKSRYCYLVHTIQQRICTTFLQVMLSYLWFEPSYYFVALSFLHTRLTWLLMYSLVWKKHPKYGFNIFLKIISTDMKNIRLYIYTNMFLIQVSMHTCTHVSG